MINVLATICAFLFVILLIAAGYLLAAWIVVWAWNIALVPLFGWPTLELLQAFAILLMLSIVGGFFKNSTKSS